MIVRVFAGASWSGASVHGDHDFDEVPRVGEVLAFGGDAWEVGTVQAIAHRVADGETADVALLVSPLRQGRRAYEALPVDLLDQEEAGDPVVPATPHRPWG